MGREGNGKDGGKGQRDGGKGEREGTGRREFVLCHLKKKTRHGSSSSSVVRKGMCGMGGVI